MKKWEIVIVNKCLKVYKILNKKEVLVQLAGVH